MWPLCGLPVRKPRTQSKGDRTWTPQRQCGSMSADRHGIASEARWLSLRQIAGDLGVSSPTAYKWSTRGVPWFPRTIPLHNGDIRVLSFASLKGPPSCQKHGTTSRPLLPTGTMISAHADVSSCSTPIPVRRRFAWVLDNDRQPRNHGHRRGLRRTSLGRPQHDLGRRQRDFRLRSLSWSVRRGRSRWGISTVTWKAR
jgi:predicted DNA-binding transcriptional regulator AlpA